MESLRSLAASSRFADLPDAARKSVETKLKETEQQYHAKRLELNDLVYKLVDSEFWDSALSWPGLDADGKDKKADVKGKGRETGQGPSWDESTPTHSGAEERFKELRVVVWQVRDQVKELYRLMDELRGAPTEPPDNAEKSIEADANRRPMKRRRTGDLTSSIPDEQLEDINDKLDTLDGRLTDLENTMIQFDNEVVTELDRRMEERFQELNLATTGGDADDRMAVDGPSNSDPGQDGAPSQKKSATQRVELIEQDVLKVGEEIYQLALEIAAIIEGARKTDAEVTRLSQENEELRNRVTAVSVFSSLSTPTS